MGRVKEIVIDALDPAKLASFWAAMLDGYAVRPYDQAELDRLAGLGLSPATDPAVAIDGPGPTFFFQLTRQSKQNRNRVHLDISCASRSDEVERLVGLGASVREVRAGYTVMLDPEGNEFCVVEGASMSTRSGLS